MLLCPRPEGVAPEEDQWAAEGAGPDLHPAMLGLIPGVS